MKIRLLLTLVWLALTLITVSAQEGVLPEANVYVTTQDYVSFRTGPGKAFQRLAVIPAEVTLPAYGRTSDTRWVQVEYNGQLGWIAAYYLVWSGDVINLTIDGLDPTPFIRRAAALGRTIRETPIYAGYDVLDGMVGSIPAGETVELTGRLGGTGFFRFQVRYDGQLYWVGSWDIRVIEGDYRRLLDLAYLYPYGRLVTLLEKNLALAVGSYSQITDVWRRLAQGSQVACEPIPPRVQHVITDADARKELSFVPAVAALDSAIESVNRAISAFEDACGTPDFVLTPEFINTQLAELDNAERSLIIAGSLLEPLRRRNPLISGGNSGN
ncbi:MAG: SH3 domain-containing protein [Chloroflexi bacterium]|nr:SH3 domain-containing protein [Chloroflexota bacterium]